jgi:dTDP-4-amino-4,6-dideoxygalactose transaminase
MKVDFFNLNKINKLIKNDVLKEISKIINKSSFVEGSYVKKFEEQFAQYCGAKYCVAINNGTSALQLAIEVINGNPTNKNVATPPNSFFATSASIKHANLKPYFIDVDGSTFNIDTNKLEKEKNKYSGIVPVSLYGNPCNLTKISEISKKNKKFFVHDACQAHGAKHKNKKIAEFADLTCFSFYPSKNLGCFGEGGAIVTNNYELYKLLYQLKNQGQEERYHHKLIGYNFRMDEIQAAVLLIKLKYLNEWNDERINIANRYIHNLSSNSKINLLKINSEDKCVYHLFPIFTQYKNNLIKIFNEKNIGCGFHYPIPIHQQPPFNKNTKKYTYTELSKDQQISLPIFIGMKNKEIDYVCEAINTL